MNLRDVSPDLLSAFDSNPISPPNPIPRIDIDLPHNPASDARRSEPNTLRVPGSSLDSSAQLDFDAASSGNSLRQLPTSGGPISANAQPSFEKVIDLESGSENFSASSEGLVTSPQPPPFTDSMIDRLATEIAQRLRLPIDHDADLRPDLIPFDSADPSFRRDAGTVVAVPGGQKWDEIPQASPRSFTYPGPAGADSDRLIDEILSVGRVIADRTRIRILQILAEERELNVRTLCERLDQSQPSVSHHLAQMRNANLVTLRRDGKNNYYCLTPGRIAEFLSAFRGLGLAADRE